MNSFFGLIYRGSKSDKSRTIIESGISQYRKKYGEPTHVFVSNNLSLVEIDNIKVAYDDRLKANEVWVGVYTDEKDTYGYSAFSNSV